MAEGTSLYDVLSESVFQNLIDTLYDLGLPPDSFLIYKPWLLALMLTEIQIAKLGFIDEYGVEDYFHEKKPERMDILELESFETQLRMLESLDEELYLAYTLLYLKAAQAEVKLLIDAWQCADKKKLRQLTFDNVVWGGDDFSVIEQKMFYDRNMNFATKIQEFLKRGDGNYFVVVGAGHLVGDNNVVSLLQRSGYTVLPVRKASRTTKKS